MSLLDHLHDQFDARKDPAWDEELLEVKEEMTCEELAEELWNDGFWGGMNSEAYWNDNFNALKYFKALKTVATERDIELTDLDSWDYQTYFWEQYKADSDKGLS